MNKKRLIVAGGMSILMSPFILAGALSCLIAQYLVCGWKITEVLLEELEKKLGD